MKDPLALLRVFVELDRRSRDGLDPAEFRRWLELKRMLARRLQPGLSDAQADRRTSIRVAARMRVGFGDLEELQRCWMTNLGRGGLFVATERPSPIGTRLSLRIAITATGEEIDVPAEVVCHDLDPRMQARRGMGLRFLSMPEDVRKKLDDLYEVALADATRSS